MTAMTRAVIRRLFGEADQPVVVDLLEAQCGVTLPLTERWQDAQFERLWLAVLKLSEGRVEGLRTAIATAQRDWRDVLVASGFGDSLDAHRRWATSLTSSPR
jgi:hypothetical protein